MNASRKCYNSRNTWSRLVARYRNRLETPQILYQNNHLLVVNKPPGWASVPNTTPEKKRAASVDEKNRSSSSPRDNQQDRLLSEPACASTVTADSTANSNKNCLLTYLGNVRQLGGGSQRSFLLPLHRLDQPCTGVLIFGKTSKAASRIQTQWKKGTVEKTYIAVLVDSSNNNNNNNKAFSDSFCHDAESKASQPSISRNLLHRLYQMANRSPQNLLSAKQQDNHNVIQHLSAQWWELEGILVGKERPRNNPLFAQRYPQRGWSVKMIPYDTNGSTDQLQNNKNEADTITAAKRQYDCKAVRHDQVKYRGSNNSGRVCRLRWTLLRLIESPRNTNTYTATTDKGTNSNGSSDTHHAHSTTAVVLVRTHDGARHMIRALLALYDCPIAGDVRYGGPTTRKGHERLPDSSVALHARQVVLPDSSTMKLPLERRSFVAPVPTTWSTFFHSTITEPNIQQWEHESVQ